MSTGGQAPDWTSLRGLVFDFDGVVLESAEIKTEAFRELFADRPEHQEAIVEYHLDHLGISRFEKFAWVYANLLGQELTPERSRSLGDAYGEIVRKKVLACPFVPGAEELLREIRPAWPSFVASGTPEDELRWIVRERRMEGFFDEVWGSPRSKVEILTDIMERRGLAPRDLLMIGDGLTDYRAAVAVGMPFLARVTPAMEARWSELDVVSVRGLDELSALLRLPRDPASKSTVGVAR